MRLLTHKQLADHFSVSLEEIDKYVRKDILKPLQIEGAMFFDNKAVLRVSIIAKGVALGFSLDELKMIIERMAVDW